MESEGITYLLRTDRGDKDFYSELEKFRNKLLNKAKIEYFDTVSAYQTHIKNNKIESPRQWEEYFLELLMLGVFWNTYSPYISSRTKHYKFLFNGLYNIRSRNEKIKPYADKSRGYLATTLLTEKKGDDSSFDLRKLRLLLDWMDCTKEFLEEVKRLNNWLQFFENNIKFFRIVQKSIPDFAEKFKIESRIAFGEYTKNVESFLIERHPKYKFEENYFFTGRREVEYHLNMVGASILNQALQEKFSETKKQIVLLPTCMSSGKSCKAIKRGFEMLCSHCSKKCNVSKITKELSESAVGTVLIPHSSKFSDYLKFWSNQDETGLVGVACVLNLLRGGYELMDLNIASQCVFLDQCGCKKHWSRDVGVQTNLNVKQLKKLLHLEDVEMKRVN